jgi:diguanylate cyclase (GGDEF)-like protein
MSFRTRLTSFFVLIVVIPLVAVGVLVFRLINDSQQGKADARANGVASVAASLYQSHSLQARADARTLAKALTASPQAINQSRIAALATQSGLARVRVSLGDRRVADVGGREALAPGTAIASLGPDRGRLVVVVSELTAADYVRGLSSPGTAAVVRAGPRVLASSLGTPPGPLPTRGTTTVAGASYRTVSQRFSGFGGQPVFVSVLSSLAASTGSVAGSRILAAALIVAVLVLAVAFSLLASRGLQGQLSRFLQAARRLGGGDFSSPIQTVGRDEFAALGQEFNNMSQQLAGRLDELSQERARLREAIHRIGQTFASNLDRSALLDLALKTAIDAVQASAGRVSARANPDKPLVEVVREGALSGMQDGIYDAERKALQSRDCGDSASAGGCVLSVPLGPRESDGRLHGLITVARPEGAFSADDREVLRSLATQAALALENVELHLQVSRQAVTDELTGLANHRRFQELLGIETEQVRRYGHSVGLIMLDIDDFKAVNDTYGHQQGDVVLRRVARALADSSREADLPARYGGEELALILPHTDIEGAYAIAERIRTAIEALRILGSDGDTPLRITASLGVAASRDGHKEGLIAEADAALYEAKHQGKNRTVRARVGAANVFGGE